MSIDRWNREDSARLARVEQKLDQVLAKQAPMRVVNTLAQGEPKPEPYGVQACAAKFQTGTQFVSLSDHLRRIDLQQEEQWQATSRVDGKLDALLGALAAEGEEEQEAPATSLDGDALPGERDQSQSLG